MSEQPLVTERFDPTEEYGWQDVAADMQEQAWHPELQELAVPHLVAHGVLPPEAAINSAQAPVAVATAESTTAPERKKVLPGEIVTAFTEGQRTMYSLTADPKFHANCLEQGIDPYDDIDTPNYWAAVANYTHGRIVALRERGGNNLRLSTLELLAATPAYLFEQQALNESTPRSAAEQRHSKEVASYFNGLVRDFAAEFPETRASSLTTALLNVTNIAIEGKAMRQAAAQQLQQTIRGAQHESAFGQILAQTGHTFRGAELAEDLRGIDYVIDEESEHALYVDVKASLSEVEARGSNEAFVRRPDGKIVMYSLTKDSELRDTFRIQDPEAVAAKAVILEQLLAQASQ